MQAHELHVGDTVVATRDLGHLERYGGRTAWGSTIRVDQGMVGRVTRIASESVVVRWQLPSGNERSTWLWVGRDQLDWAESSEGRRLTRRLGEKPEDTDGMTYIGIDHPGIQWLWEDLGTYASRKNWCPQYDQLARDIGIPGRKQRFTVRRAINVAGFNTVIERSIMAQSLEEAEASLNPLLERLEKAFRESLTEGELDPAS